MEDYQYITYETAVLAEEKGFNIPCLKLYKDGTPRVGDPYDFCSSLQSKEFPLAPTQSFLQKWLRDIKNIHIMIDIVNLGSDEYTWTLYDLYEEKRIKESFVGAGNSYHGTFETYEQALEDALVESLKII